MSSSLGLISLTREDCATMEFVQALPARIRDRGTLQQIFAYILGF